MIDLIFITESFPYNDAKEGTFIDPELDCFINGAFGNEISITFLPLQFNSSENPDKTYKVSTLLRNAYSHKAALLFDVLLFDRFYREVINRCLRKNGSQLKFWQDVKWIARWALQYKATQRALTEFLSGSASGRKVCVYTYWFNGCTSAAIDLKLPKLDTYKVITRTHGYDLYRTTGWKSRRGLDLSKLDKVFPVSIAGKYELDKNNRYKSIKTLYLGVKKEQEIVDEVEFNECNIRVCSCSYLVPVKRVPLLLEGLILLADKEKNKKIIWHHFGSGPQEQILYEKLKSIPGNLEVLLKGESDNHEVRRSMHANGYSAFVNTSTSEGLPVSLMEALEAGIPLVATDVGGNGEIVSKDVGRLISSNPSLDEIADAIIICHDNYTVLSKNAKNKWAETFDSEVNHKKFYNEIISIF